MAQKTLDAKLVDIATKLLADGKTICYAEYRLCESAEREYMSERSGKVETFSGVWHTVEFPTKSVAIADAGEGGEGFDAEKYQSPFTKGEMVIIEIDQKGYVKGKGERWRGVIHSAASVDTKKAKV